LVYIDILTGKEVGSDSYDSPVVADGVVLGMVSSKCVKGGEKIDIGANASENPEGGGEDEGVEDAQKQVINVVDTHELVKIELQKKEFSSAIKVYYKGLLKALQQRHYDAVGLGKAYEPPADKAAAKAAIAEAVAKLGKFEKPSADAAEAAISKFKANFPKLEAFMKDVVQANFEEFEFYIPANVEFGECIIIPARYEGAATAPTFYVPADGIIQEKQ